LIVAAVFGNRLQKILTVLSNKDVLSFQPHRLEFGFWLLLFIWNLIVGFCDLAA
jgi:hypothetical protein